MTYQQLKYDFMQDELSKLFEKYKVFFAFNDKQFKEGLAKHGLSEDEPLVSIVSGGIIPKKNAEQFHNAFNSLHNRMIEEIKKLDPEPIIRYELANYESWYTGDITNAWDVLRDYGYTKQQVRDVYHKYSREGQA